MAHINKSIFGRVLLGIEKVVLLGIEKVVKTFSISNKLFPKLVYYCRTHINKILYKIKRINF